MKGTLKDVESGFQPKACWNDNLGAGGLLVLKNSLCRLEMTL